MKITKKTKIGKILEEKGEKGAEVLREAGMSCVFCPMSQEETLEQGCLGHGLDEKDVEKIIKELGELNKEK